MLNMENYRQLSAKMHLISMRLASCLLTQLTTCLFSPDISPVGSSLSGFKFAGEGKRRKEFAEWHVAWRAEWHNYEKYEICGMT